MFQVVLLNDDYTPMDFVIEVLKKYFDKDHTTATEIMLNIHQRGKGICGLYPYDIAETKSAQVTDEARRSNHPLQCTLEQA
jgi:ATP-dependent Clp protease adaptor protein ClpS